MKILIDVFFVKKYVTHQDKVRHFSKEYFCVETFDPSASRNVIVHTSVRIVSHILQQAVSF